jgi:hypothetical protein
MEWDFSSYALGATLYMPIVHHRVPAYLSGEVRFPASSVVLCLEDALADDDVSGVFGGKGFRETTFP